MAVTVTGPNGEKPYTVVVYDTNGDPVTGALKPGLPYTVVAHFTAAAKP